MMPMKHINASIGMDNPTSASGIYALDITKLIIALQLDLSLLNKSDVMSVLET